jgi:hypothetical protein
MTEPFNWETGRAMSVKALLDARDITDQQAELLKERLALAVQEICPGQEGAVKASIAEPGSRRWAPVGEKVPLAGAEPLFTVADVLKHGAGVGTDIRDGRSGRDLAAGRASE